jgi:hypothetical protein
MPKFLRILQFLSLLGLLGACGDTATIVLGYTVSGSPEPDLIVIIEANKDLSIFKQNVPSVLVGGQGRTFYDDNSNLRQCAAELGFIDLVANPDFLSSGEAAGLDTITFSNCLGLSSSYSADIFAGTSLNITDGLGVAEKFSLGSKTDGYVFAIFFFDQASPASSDRCFQVYAAEIRAKKIVSLGSLVSSDSIGVDASDAATCFDYI